MKQVILGIDAGTSSVKVCTFTLDGQPITRDSVFIQTLFPKSGRAELNVSAYWKGIRDSIDAVISQGYRIEGIGISSTCPCWVLMDESFEAIGNGICYLDNRATAQLSRYLSNFKSTTDFFEHVGNRASISTCCNCTLSWIKENEPERWRKTKYIGMLNSFIAAKLTGCGAVDWSQASYTGVFRLSLPMGWDSELVRLSGIEEDKLLPVVPSVTCIGRTPIGIPVAIGSGDTAAAAFGLGFSSSDKAFESAGTSDVLTFCLDKPEFNDVFMNRCHVIPDKWLAHGATSSMGGAFDWLRTKIFTEFTEPSALDEIEPLLARGAGGLVFLPYLSGERSPIWDSNAKGLWYGLNLNTNRLDMIEAVYEGCAFSVNQIKEHAVDVFKNDISSIIAVGNVTRSCHLSQLKSDIFGVSYKTAIFSDAASYGAALMGGCAAGLFKDPADSLIPAFPKNGRLYKPQPLDSQVEKNYRIYKQLYPILKNLMNNQDVL